MLDIWIVLEHCLFKTLHLCLGIGNGTVLRQGPVDHQFRTVGLWEELTFDKAHTEHRNNEQSDCRDNGDPLMAHGQKQCRRKGFEKATALFLMMLHFLRKKRHTEKRRKQHGHNP